MYISDGENNRISIFTTDGYFIRSFGERGNRLGEFNRPHGMAFHDEGNIYVCDFSNNRSRLVVY